MSTRLKELAELARNASASSPVAKPKNRTRAREICPFCKLDPYEYVDVGIGYVAVAVTCCDYGIALIQQGNPYFIRIARLMSSPIPRRQARAKRMLAKLPY